MLCMKRHFHCWQLLTLRFQELYSPTEKHSLSALILPLRAVPILIHRLKIPPKSNSILRRFKSLFKYLWHLELQWYYVTSQLKIFWAGAVLESLLRDRLRGYLVSKSSDILGTGDEPELGTWPITPHIKQSLPGSFSRVRSGLPGSFPGQRHALVLLVAFWPRPKDAVAPCHLAASVSAQPENHREWVKPSKQNNFEELKSVNV